MIEDLENLTKNGWEKSADGVAIKKTFYVRESVRRKA